MIELKNCSIGFVGGKKDILSNLNLKLLQGELISLIGINGSGKSTLIKTICGLIPVRSGEIKINNSSTTHFDVAEFSKLISLVVTDKFTYGNIDVFSLVALGRVPYTGMLGILSKEDIIKVEQAIELTGLQSYVWKNANELSDGEKQRVMIARAIAQDTPIIIMDEPTAFLDVVQRRKVLELLTMIKIDLKKSILISTHEIELAKEFSNHLWLIDNHQINCISEKSTMDRELKQLFGA